MLQPESLAYLLRVADVLVVAIQTLSLSTHLPMPSEFAVETWSPEWGYIKQVITIRRGCFLFSLPTPRRS